MNPKLGTLFPLVKNEALQSLEVEKVNLSRNTLTMEIIFASNTTTNEAQWACETVRSAYSLRGVSYKISEKKEYIDKNVMVYTLDDSEMANIKDNSNPLKPTILGKANVTEMLYGRAIKSDLVSISSIHENSGTVTVSGRVFSLDEREIKSKKTEKEFHLITMDITDMTDSVTLKMFINKTEDDEPFKKLYGTIKKGLKAGNIHIVCRGNAQYDDYAHEVIIMAKDIAQIDAPPIRRDDEVQKRVELHMHTQMSQMDAVSSTADLINRAIYWGHKAVAITDHGVVQSYPDAMKASSLNEKIKVIYGVEGYLVDDSKKIAYETDNATLDSDFVVFDIETTGLDFKTNNVTEIGAVKVSGGKIVDKWSTFVNPEMKIPENIQALTGISDEMVADAKPITEILPEFKRFCEGCVLVAHNASFDIGFLKQKATEIGDTFNFPYIDTLILARCMYPFLHNHKLDTLTKHLNVILENHHRAVDDAAATAEAFVKMIEQLKNESNSVLSKLNEVYDLRAAAKRNRANHIILLAKNQTGLRNIYEMVSQSHLRYFQRTPRLPRSLIAQKRDGLIIGSACEAGELFTALVEGASDETLMEIAQFYDYLEIQPIGNNAYMKRSTEFPHINTDEDLGEKCNKIVCATCDVHFLDKDGADYRKILMHYKGFKDADNQAPLYFRTTAEMLKEFEYLGKEKAYEVVVTNTNLIADMVENVRPIPKEKCPPVVDGAKEAIVDDSIKKAKEMYPELNEVELENYIDDNIKDLNYLIRTGTTIADVKEALKQQSSVVVCVSEGISEIVE